MSAPPECVKCGDYVYHAYVVCDECAKIDTRHTPNSAYQWVLGLIEQLQTRGIDYKEITYTDCAAAIAAASSLTTHVADLGFVCEESGNCPKEHFGC